MGTSGEIAENLYPFSGISQWQGTQEMLSQIHYLARKYECDIRLMNTPNLEVSSSDIRKRIKEGLPISEFVPEAVEKYIAEKHLFEEEHNEAVDTT